MLDRFPKLKIDVGHVGEAVPVWLWGLDFMALLDAAAARTSSRSASNSAGTSQMRPLRSVVITALSVCMGCSDVGGGDVSIQVSEEPAVSSCVSLEEETDRTMRDDVIRFFVEHLGEEVTQLTITRGSMCEGRVVFAIRLPGQEHAPFFVETEIGRKQRKLIRPL